MQQIWRSIYTVILLLVVQAAYAQSSTELTDLLKSTQSMKANFTQTLYDARGKAKQTSYGNMAMQKPGKFRWEVTKPMPQLIIANQKTLWIFDPDLEQVTIRSLSKATGETPAFLLTDSSAVDAHYTVKTVDKKQANWRWFALTPKKADNMFESIQMGFTNNQIQEMRLQDNLDNVTVIQFKKIEINPALSSTLFTFKAKPNIDVIDETRKK